VQLLAEQVPLEVIKLLLYLFGTVLDGRKTPVMDGIPRSLGRAPRDFRKYTQRAAASGVWGGLHG
jgi:hypothetical protein